MQFDRAALEAKVAVESANFGFGEIAEPVVLNRLGSHVSADRSALRSILHRDLLAAERAAHDVDGRALMGEAVLHRDADGAADGVEAVDGIVAEHHDVIDGDGRDEVQIDRVTEGFVDPDAVLVDGKSLRASADRRGVETAVLNVRSEAAARRIRQNDSRNQLVEHVLRLS